MTATINNSSAKKVSWKNDVRMTPKKDINGNHEKENVSIAEDDTDSIAESKTQLTDLKQKQLEKQQKQQKDSKSSISKSADQKNSRGSKAAVGHVIPKRSNSEPDFALKQKSSNERYHVCIMCTPEKKFFMKNLQTQLEKLGYLCKVCTSSDDYIPILESDALICCLSWRFSKSSIAAREIAKAEKMQKPIVPLLSDNIEYPPSGPLRVSMSRLVPIDCSMMKINAKWEGREQTEEILDRLEAYVADDSMLKHRTTLKHRQGATGVAGRKQTNIPRAANSIWREKPSLPIDPLAREASEIRIMIRPPTPVRRDISNIPLPERLINHGNEDEEEEEEEEDEGNDVEDSEESYEEDNDDIGSNKGAQDDDDDTTESSHVSTDSEEIREEAERRRRLEKLNKLPQLPDARRKIEQNNHYASVGSGSNKNSSSRNQGNQGTKLPSVYTSKYSSNNRRY